MTHPLIVFNVVAAEMLRSALQQQTPSRTTAASPPWPTTFADWLLSTNPSWPGRRKRDADRVEVTIASRQKFDPDMNLYYLKVFEARIEQHAKRIGLKSGRKVEGKVRNSGGKFAVVYNLPDAICDKVIDFVKGAKENTNVVEHAAVKCEGREKVFL
ncbi:unnamed protein product [Heligmosomoides polygyrus]|uniref:50S ribosomal protein L22 n=1 Tax=Heligmosomoides polygyrus TaxID=6339 RepID=A0A183GES2_HELPZ|nr:unnamed protein product [Heligmosomoides polygyrus]